MNHQEFEDNDKPLAIVFSTNGESVCFDVFDESDDVQLQAENFGSSMRDEWVTTWTANKKAQEIMSKRRLASLGIS